MEQEYIGNYVTIIVLLIWLVATIFFLITQQQTLQLIQPEHRHMSPGQVWLQLIPVFGLVWQFFVISRLSTSIRSQLVTPVEDSILSEGDIVPPKPTYTNGMTYAVLTCTILIPLPYVKSILAAVCLGSWIVYWLEVNKYKKKIKARVMAAL